MSVQRCQMELQWWPPRGCARTRAIELQEHAPHLSVLHERVSFSTGHLAPPCAAATLMVRVRVWKPPSQSLSQSLHLLQSDTTQSTAPHAVVPGGHTPALPPM